MTSQLVGLTLAFALMDGRMFLFLRLGSEIKLDENRKNEDWRSITQGG
ncbi:hypothetical protein ABTD29_19665 [Acinetobacter baumannii]